jgi:hypothetical protein
MTNAGRKRIAHVPANPWRATLDRLEGSEPTQAGEDVPEEDDVRSKASTDETPGVGGYGGDMAELGHDAAMAEPDRPADTDVGIDPRTSEGEEFPDEEQPNEPADEMRAEDAEERDADSGEEIP